MRLLLSGTLAFVFLACATQSSSETPETPDPGDAEPTVFVEVPPEPPRAEPEPTEAPPPEPTIDPGVREQAKRLFGEGVEFFQAGDFAAAVAKFEQAYQLAPMPQLLFNIARAHEQLGDVLSACRVYRTASTDPGSDDSLRAEAGNRIAQLNCP